MRSTLLQSAALLAALLWSIAAGWGADEGPVFREALAALQLGDFRGAEQKLRPEVAAHPNSGSALSLLGVALDKQNQFREAAEFHRRAVAAAPRAVDILGNYGNHLLATGEDGAARDAFLKVVALDPGNLNAKIQLARQALKRKNGTEALGYLKKLPAGQLEAPNVAPVRLEALYLAGGGAVADALATRLASAAQGDAGESFSLGLVLAHSGRFAQAEVLFSRVLAVAPADFNILFNLGAVAASAGHFERAREVLETASRQQPENVEVLYRLAGIYHELGQPQAAVPLLAQAAKLAPWRADVQKLLALNTTALGALEDALAAWDAYLKLAPEDDFARRDRAYTAVRMGQREVGIAGLEGFLARHPGDATGHYQMGMATDGARGLAHLDRALQIQPDFAAALNARGALYYRQGNPEAARTDLERAAKLRPEDGGNLDRLGQTYLMLDRPGDAARVLRRAAELEPGDSRIQLHFARALADAGQTAESKVVMDRFRQLGPAPKNGVPAGLIEFLGLTAVQRRADYRSRVEKAVGEHPEDAAAQLAHLKMLLEDGHVERAQATARLIAELQPGAGVLAEAGRALLASGQYTPAKEMLTGAARSMPPAEVALDLDLATAQVLDASGRHEEAIAALGRALAGAPPRADIYWQAAGLMVRNQRISEAIVLFEGAREAEMVLMKAVLLELGGQSAEAEKVLSEVQNGRPEWYAVWVARGMMQAAHNQMAEARHSLETAAALGARSPEVRDVLAGKGNAGLRELFLARPPGEW